jgi:subtilisin family serine protease
MDPLELVRLLGLMGLTSGSADVVLGLVDGPVALDHPAFACGNIQVLNSGPRCASRKSGACQHGTFVAGVLSARRGSGAPAIAPDCTLVIRPVLSDPAPLDQLPSASPRELAAAIIDCVNAGVRVINLSATLVGGSFGADQELADALEFTASRRVLMVAASGNQGVVAGSPIINYRWIIPVVACDRFGRPLAQSNLCRAVGVGGIGGPGEAVASLGLWDEPAVFSGTSVATPFVVGAIALLWSLFPEAGATEIKNALLLSTKRRKVIVPPLLDAWGAYEILTARYAKGVAS